MVLRGDGVDRVIQDFVFVSARFLGQAVAHLPDVADQPFQRGIQALAGQHRAQQADYHAGAHHEHHHVAQPEAGLQQFAPGNHRHAEQPVRGGFQAQHAVFTAADPDPVLLFPHILPAGFPGIRGVRRQYGIAFRIRQQQRAGVAFRQAGH